MSTGELLAGRYRLEGMLGCGGMGEVHKAWDTHLWRHVALKMFPAGSGRTARQRFDNEIHLMAKLSHPNLVSVYDAGDSDGLSFVALQLVDGPTLRDRLVDAPLPADEVRAVGALVADALAYVHANGVVHRDVKPANILLDPDGLPHLADFGLARLTGATRLTRCDEMVGTAAYLAPEQVRGGDIGPPADVYALGLVLLECLTGRREYGGNEIEAAVARLHRPPLVPASLPADLARLLVLMTSLAPHRRPTAAQCADTLRGVVTAVSTTPVDRRHRTARRVLVAAAVGALAVTGASLAAVGDAPPATSEPRSPAAPAPTSQVPEPQPQQVVITHTVVVPSPPAVPAPRADNSGHGGNKGKKQKPDRPGKED